ncbi:hypothetical protein FS837_004917 [Tulasnella sp. UAMH 9824]|nr:hypothetical protein FS837_004917 [Tulasnella sp. UAMH 9824]
MTLPIRSWEKVYPELERTTTNKNRPDPLTTGYSILPLSQTCRYLYKVTSPFLLETIRLGPSSFGDGVSEYLSVIQQVKSLQLNSNQRLQHVKGFGVAFSHLLKFVNTGHKSDLRNQICHLLTRFPNLRHLAVVGMALDLQLMHGILALPLEHLFLSNVEPDNPIANHTFIPTTTPRINLRSLVLPVDLSHDFLCIPANWISQLIGKAMQDLAIDANELVPPALPVLPNLELLEVPAYFRMDLIRPSALYGFLSKTPNLKELAVDIPAAPADPDTIPVLTHLERIVCHASWLPVLIPGRPITTAKVLCDSQVRVRELFEVLHKGSAPLRDLTLTYAITWGPLRLSPDDLEPIARYLPELEILRLENQDTQVGTRAMD